MTTSDQSGQPHTPSSDSPRTEFDALNLPTEVLAGVREAGFVRMTPIQEKALPVALAGADLCGQAQTGTGKTATFLLALFTRLLAGGEGGHSRRPQALVLAPTRELAQQIEREGSLLGGATGLRLLAIYGGEGYARQEKGLKEGCDVVIGTPGRLLDFARRGVLDLGGIRFLVIDEADRLLDLGFWDELKAILRKLPEPSMRQSMLFSATLDSNTRRIARDHMNAPQDITVRPEQVTAEGIDQTVYHVDRDEKFRLLLGILGRETIAKGLIFTNMKITAAWLAEKLMAHGYEKVGLLTGDLRQAVRNRVLSAFQEGRMPLLVASDVASRGLHIDDVTHIINYDVPQDPEDYVHRIGRTARAGKKGKAYTLACDKYCYSLPEIEKLTGYTLPYLIPQESDFGQDKAPGLTVKEMLSRMRREKHRKDGHPPQKRRPRAGGPAGRGGPGRRRRPLHGHGTEPA